MRLNLKYYDSDKIFESRKKESNGDLEGLTRRRCIRVCHYIVLQIYVFLLIRQLTLSESFEKSVV